MGKTKSAISIDREVDFPAWYQEVIKVADLAENAPVRGCMTIKPFGYALWEQMQKRLDIMIKEKEVDNAYFPLFIPLSFLQKEADHVEGFAMETALVTHTRLEKNVDGALVPASPLEEPLVVRPTSEMIIAESFSRWISSYRDLPLKINQWANVVRWEMRPRIFLRTTEFLWQEGHTAHSSAAEAKAFAKEMQDLYAHFVQEYLAMPVLVGQKSEGEKFPGAESTYTIEAMMQDGKALQLGTSHYMGQNFAKSSNIRFSNKNSELEFAYTTSWGITTRMIGGLIMTHSDDNGFVMPPAIASTQIVIIPIAFDEEKMQSVLAYCELLKKELEELELRNNLLRVKIDKRDERSGAKSWGWIKKGVPVRIEIGMRDIEGDCLQLFQRDMGPKEAIKLSNKELVASMSERLEGMQKNLYEKALKLRDENIVEVSSIDQFEKVFAAKDFPSPLVKVAYNGDLKLEKEISDKYGVTIRCLLEGQGKCAFTNSLAKKVAIFARSY
jgi:prolyl-tRNA synthetase